MIEFNHVDEARDLLARHRPALGAEDPRGFEWRYLWRLCHVGGRTLRGHEGDVYHTEFSPDGEILATCGRDRTVRLWDVATGATRRVLIGHSHEVNWVTFAPDGRTLATAGEDRTVKLWDAATGREERTLSGHDTEVVIAQFARDGRRLVSCDRKGTVILWDPATGRQQSSFRASNPFVETMAISPDGKTLAVAGRGAGLWDLATGQQRLVLEEGPYAIRCVAFFHNGMGLIASRNVVSLLEPTGRLARTYKRRGSSAAVALSPDDRLMATADERGLVEIEDFQSGFIGTIATGQGRIWCAAFAPDGRSLVTASEDGIIKFWDIPRDLDRCVIPVRAARVHSMAFSPDGRTLSAVGGQGTIWSWETAGGKPLSTREFVQPGPLECAMLSGDAATLATLGRDWSCRVWDVKSGRLIRLIEEAMDLGKLRISPDGRRLAFQSGSFPMFRMRISNTEDGKEFSIGNPGQRVDWVFSPDRRNFAWAGLASPVLGDLASGQTRIPSGRGHFAPIHTLEFSADGRTLATGGQDRVIKLWDVNTLVERSALQQPEGEAMGLSFSPDGTTLASFDTRNAVMLWDLPASELGYTLGPNPHPVQELRFSPDGTTLAVRVLVGEGMNAIHLWPAPRED